MASIVTTFTGSELSPVYFDVPVYSGSDQIIRMYIRPQVQGGIASQTFSLMLQQAYSDPSPALSVAGTINDPTGCVVDFIIAAAQAVGLSGRYIATAARTDAGNAGPLAVGQARAVEF